MTTTNFEIIVAKGIDMGSVVKLDNGRRRYAVTHVDACGQLGMIALSGAFSGCAPSSVNPERLTVVAGAKVEFTGAKRAYLANRYSSAVRMLGSAVNSIARMHVAASDLPAI